MPEQFCTYYRHIWWVSDYLHIHTWNLKSSLLRKNTTPPSFLQISQVLHQNISLWQAYLKTYLFFFFFWLVKKGSFFQYSDYHGKTWCLHLQWPALDASSLCQERRERGTRKKLSNSLYLKMPNIRTPISWKQSVYQFCTCLTVALTGFNSRLKHLSNNKNDVIRLVRLKKNGTKCRNQSYRLLMPIQTYNNLSVLAT